MDYYFISPLAVEEDEETTFVFTPGQPTRAENIGIEFHYWPFDDIFTTGTEFFCTEQLKCKLMTEWRHLSGIVEYKITRATPSSNWISNYPDSHPNPCWQMLVGGVAMQDDFGLYPTRNLVCSERAVKFLLNNHCSNIQGIKIEGDIKKFFDDYALKLKESNFSYSLPKIFDINTLFT